MYTRRASLLIALILTGALLFVMPDVFYNLSGNSLRMDDNRMDERLRPARARTLTVWVLDEDVHDDKLLLTLCAAFEKEVDGMRVFLRRVCASELSEKNIVKPDAMLYPTGSVVNPEQLFLVLSDTQRIPADALLSGNSSSESYALPLWYAPNVLSLPAQWLQEAGAPTPTPRADSLFNLGTPAPEAACEAKLPFVEVEGLPWRMLLQKEALAPPVGLALQQMLFVCPLWLRGELVEACTATASALAHRQEVSTSANESDQAVASHKILPAPQAHVVTLAQYLASVKAGENVAACPLAPAVSETVRYLSLCRDSVDARAFVHFLLSDASQQAVLTYGLLPIVSAQVQADPLTTALLERYQSGLLFPNAFAHTREELRAVCIDAFTRAVDPVETLLRLR